MTEQDFNLLLTFFRTLADPTRLKLLGLISDRERSVGELATLLAVSEPTVSHHLSRLKALELVSVRAEGTVRYYKLDKQALGAMNRRMFNLEEMTTVSENAAVDAFDQKVLKDYVKAGELKQIPTKQKKLLVILRWLADDFEPGRRYAEREVNEIIQRHHPDYASLRRELVDFHFMEREGGMYWRVENPTPQE